MPVIIQSFELPSLRKFSQMSDLPLVFLHWYFSTPEHPDYDQIDWVEIASFVNGIGAGPQYQQIVNPLSLVDRKDEWDVRTVRNAYSKYVKFMHSLDLAVHTYTL